jgi:hypothetical protein
MLHSWFSATSPHETPPLADETSIARVRRRKPPPQLKLHSLKVVHWVMTQSTGHVTTAQAFVSVLGPQPTPPSVLTAVTVLVRRCTPPPHVTAHADHVSHVNWQLAGQDSSLQLRVSREYGHTVAALGSDIDSTLRVRCCSPPPQLFVH